MRDPLESLAQFVCDIGFDTLPPAMVQACQTSIYDTLAVAVAGSGQAGIEPVRALAREGGGTPQATVWLFGDRLPAAQAAFVNGPMARALDMGDVHEEGGHVGEYILPALLAVAELRAARGEPVSGRELLVAYAAGAEVLARVGLACRAVTTGAAEWKNPQMGSFGAAAAAAKLLGLDFERSCHAIGIAYSAMGSFDSQMYHDASLMCRVHHGFVCRDAVTAALLAEKGVTGPRHVFTGLGNFFRIFYPNTREPERLTRALGETWEFAAGNMIKPYMCCKCFHAPMYALTLLIAEEDISVETIEEIEAVVPRMAFFADANYAPDTLIARQFSAPWALAQAAVHGELFLDAYLAPDSALISRLVPRVKFRIQDDQPTWVGEVSVISGGQRHRKRIEHCIGHPQNPVSWEWLDRKMTNCARHAVVDFGSERVQGVSQYIASLAEQPDIGALTRLLSVGN